MARGLLIAGAALLLFRAGAAAAEPGRFYAGGDPKRKAVALTFDDGPGRYTPDVLRVLDESGVKATFFVTGGNAERRPGLVREILRRGHELGDHTYGHVNFRSVEKEKGVEAAKAAVEEEMRRSHRVLVSVASAAPSLCRMPHGYDRKWLGAVAAKFGYSLVNWTFGEDWAGLPEAKMLEDYRRALVPGAILLFHDGGAGREKTLAILPEVIREARQRNLSIVTVGELLK